MEGQTGPGAAQTDSMSLLNLRLINEIQPCFSIRVDCLTTLVETAERSRTAALFAQQDAAAIVGF